MISTENNNKVAVMTGATSGFGKVIANHLIKKNYRLLFLARTESKAHELVKSIKVLKRLILTL